MYTNPYRRHRSRKLLNGCFLIVVSSMFVVTNFLLTKWLTAYEVGARSLKGLDFMINDLKYDDFTDKENDILHVVTSRFMQNQPKLVALGEARLHLFETFCLPTMLKQSVDNFMWFVMADPNLDRDLLLHLQSLLEPHPNFYLIRSNDKLLTPTNVTTILSTQQEVYSHVGENQVILTGDIGMLHTQMLDPNRSLLLETRLDADDGLNSDTLSKIQEIARVLPVDKRGWQIICSNLHYEWRNNEISAIDANQTKIKSAGVLRLVKEGICVTAGYTLVRHREIPSIEFPAWPRLSHNLVIRDWPECKLVEGEELPLNLNETSSGNATYNCWKRLGYYPSAIRSRTITSAGMARVMAPGSVNKNDNRSEFFWELLQRDFYIKPESALTTAQYIKDNLQSIVSDNLKGQCTSGHSCKNSSKTKLEEILEKTNELKLGHVG
eukprot:jgi/Psemu1/287427/fgenesh1_pg.191_\